MRVAAAKMQRAPRKAADHAEKSRDGELLNWRLATTDH